MVSRLEIKRDNKKKQIIKSTKGQEVVESHKSYYDTAFNLGFSASNDPWGIDKP